MDSSAQELVQLMSQVEAKGIGWDKVEQALKVPHAVLTLYTRSGPVPVTILKGMKKMLGEG